MLKELKVPESVHLPLPVSSVIYLYLYILLFSLQAASAPHVSFDAEEGSLWTLLLTSPGQSPLGNNISFHDRNQHKLCLPELLLQTAEIIFFQMSIFWIMKQNTFTG